MPLVCGERVEVVSLCVIFEEFAPILFFVPFDCVMTYKTKSKNEVKKDPVQSTHP